MEKIEVFANEREVSSLTVRYVWYVVFLALIFLVSTAILSFSISMRVFSVKDIIGFLCAAAFGLPTYGYVSMIIDMRRFLKTGKPVLILDDDYVEVAGKRVEFSEIEKIENKNKVTFLHRGKVKRTIAILPYMKGQMMGGIEQELIRRHKLYQTLLSA